MLRRTQTKLSRIAIPAILLIASPIVAADQSLQDMLTEDDFFYDTTGTQLTLDAPFDFESAEIRFRQRGIPEVHTHTFGPGVSLDADLAQIAGGHLADSRYTYEIRFVLESVDTGEAEEAMGALQPLMFTTSGSFIVEDGAIAEVRVPGSTAQQPVARDDDSKLMASDSGDATPMDVTDSGDLAIGGYGVFGSDSTSDVFPGKVRILPPSTSPDAFTNLEVRSFADNEDSYGWHFSTQFGDFAVQRQRVSDSKVPVLGIEEDARQHSLAIDEDGRIGLGTITPEAGLHLVNTDLGNGARMLFERGGNDWVTGPYSSNRFIISKDGSSSPSNQVFRIYNTAEASNLVLRNGHVGVGTASPNQSLHVRTTDGSAQILVEDTSGDSGDTFVLKTQDAVKFRLMGHGNDLDNSWAFRTTQGGNQFAIGRPDTPNLEMRLSSGGDVEFQGDVTANGVQLTSTREAKTDFAPLDVQDVLERLSNLEISQWRYKHESEESVHFGPVAEEFHEIFGLSNGTHLNLIDTNGITFAAIQALHEKNTTLQTENRQLMERLDRIEAQLEP